MPESAGELRVCALYPDLMNIYADRGNLLLLERRCRWRGHRVRLGPAAWARSSIRTGPTSITSAAARIATRSCCALDLAEVKRDALHAVAARGGVILAVCGGYQLLGHSYQLGDEVLPGVGLVDLHTVRAEGPRLIGNVAIEVELEPGQPRVLAGFENHGGRTHLGASAKPLGRVLRGHGNNGQDGREGVREGNVIGTYLQVRCFPRTPGSRTG